MLRESGASSKPRPIGPIVEVSGILDHPLSRMTTAGVWRAPSCKLSAKQSIARQIRNWIARRKRSSQQRDMHSRSRGARGAAAIAPADDGVSVFLLMAARVLLT